jgi:hypothetical protein
MRLKCCSSASHSNLHCNDLPDLSTPSNTMNKPRLELVISSLSNLLQAEMQKLEQTWRPNEFILKICLAQMTPNMLHHSSSSFSKGLDTSAMMTINVILNLDSYEIVLVLQTMHCSHPKLHSTLPPPTSPIPSSSPPWIHNTPCFSHYSISI